jgi:glycosyltransferase involved in cell wall biosynthesis
MRLLIVSHTPHYLRNGNLVGWGPTILEIDHLAQLFDQIVHIAPLHLGFADNSALPYSSKNIILDPVPRSGGKCFRDKLNILRLYPAYSRKIISRLRWADAVHVRCPANISLLSLLILTVSSQARFRWVKYAGNWKPDNRDAWTYAFQRFILKKQLHRGIVTVNGLWPHQPSHIYSFLNPSLTDEDIRDGRIAASRKEISYPIRMLYVGRVERSKGTGTFIHIVSKLRRLGIDLEADIIGDGPEKSHFEQLSLDLGLTTLIKFHGWLPKSEINAFYSRAHFLLLPTEASEGWPKVLSEAMAFGVVPFAGAVSSIPQILADTGAGLAIPPLDAKSFVNSILDFVVHPKKWELSSNAGLKIASQFTYEHYLQSIRNMFQVAWNLSI